MSFLVTHRYILSEFFILVHEFIHDWSIASFEVAYEIMDTFWREWTIEGTFSSLYRSDESLFFEIGNRTIDLDTMESGASCDICYA